MKGKATHVIV